MGCVVSQVGIQQLLDNVIFINTMIYKKDKKQCLDIVVSS